MAEKSAGIAVSENFNGEEVIVHLIETARSLSENDTEQAREFFEKGLALSDNISFVKGSGECLFNLGKISFRQDRIHDTFKYLQEAIAVYEKAGLDAEVAQVCEFLAEVCINLGNYGQALEQQLTAFQHVRKLNDPALLAEWYNKIGNTNKVLSNYTKAAEYHFQALQIYEKINDTPGLSVTHFFLGNCFNWAGELETALEHLEQSLEFADELNKPEFQVKPTGSLATLFTKMGEYDRAIDFFYKSIDLVNITGDKLLKADLLRNLGNLYVKTKEGGLALEVLKESLEIVKPLRKGYPKNLIHLGLANAFELNGDYVRALEHYKSFNEISSDLLNEEVALKTKGIQLQYDYDETKKEKEQAQKAITLKDRFIANISHEIRTPLNGVIGMADLLADTNPTPEQLEYINTIKLSSNNLIHVINDILDYSKIQSGEIGIEQAEFRIRDVISDLAQLMKVRSNEKRIGFAVNIDNSLPDLLIGDSSRLRQVLINLLNNSIKFTSSGQVKLEVKMTNVSGLDVSVLFIVTDTGEGIPADKITTIFDSFSQAEDDSYSKSEGGTGLGLAIVKQLVDLYGGEISVNSMVGAGSEFKVELPFKLTQPLPRPKGPSSTQSELEITDLTGIHVLLVEDNKVNQFLAQKLLSRLGLDVTIAGNGNEAIEHLKKSKFDLILMDVQMPEMNGYMLTEIIRTNLPDPVNKIPIVALTAYASVQEKEKAMAVGMSDYITKPYSPHELLTAIKRQVSDVIKAGTVRSNDNKNLRETAIRNTTDQLIQFFNGNTEDVLSILQMLISQIPASLSEVESAITSENWPATFQSLHKLRSSLNLIRVPEIINMISELEEYSKDQLNTGKIPGLFSKFREACSNAVILLKSEVIRIRKKQ